MSKNISTSSIMLKITAMLFCFGFIFNYAYASTDDLLLPSAMAVINSSNTTHGGSTVSINTGVHDIIIGTIKIEYSFDLDVSKPESLMPGQEETIIVSPNNELMKIMFESYKNSRLIETTFPLGYSVRINDLGREKDGYFVISANTSVSISGPAVSNVDTLNWNESSPESFAIQAFDNAKDGDVIEIKLPTRITVGVEPYDNLALFAYHIGVLDLGTFDASPTVYETIRIIDPASKNSKPNESEPAAYPDSSGSDSNETARMANSSSSSSESFGGGCLIATAAYGTEMAPQIQMLREIRDTALMRTESGSWFISAFNTIYYAFSPTVADWERQSPLFAGAVRTIITPMMWSLSIMSNADDTEKSVLGYGTSVLALNAGLYVIMPALGILAGIKLVAKRRTVRAPVQRDDYHKVK